jgi:hypothetical protein
MHLAELVEGDTSSSAYPIYYPTEIGVEALEVFEENIKRVVRAV